MERVITKHFDVPGMSGIDVARQHGAYAVLRKLARLGPSKVMGMIVESGLRGRGGAGFPTGKKWASLPKESDGPVYLVVNADESEPGTFKDRAIIERDPHLLIEGMSITAYAIGARKAFVYVRGEYPDSLRSLDRAIAEAREASLIGASKEAILEDVVVHRGAGAYICGEETALLNSIEGRRGEPRVRPPYPVDEGLFGCPTVINNVETLSCLPFIVREGAGSYCKLGTDPSPGTKLVCVSGCVERPGVYEVEMGTPVSSFLKEEAGGVAGGRTLKAVIPGGVSTAVLTASEALSCTIDFESFSEAGSGMGSGGMIVMDDTISMVGILSSIARFFAGESCGRCAPCREGTGWIMRILKRMERGSGRKSDISLLFDLAEGMKETSLCALAGALSVPVMSIIAKFRGEFESSIQSASMDGSYDRRGVQE